MQWSVLKCTSVTSIIPSLTVVNIFSSYERSFTHPIVGISGPGYFHSIVTLNFIDFELCSMKAVRGKNVLNALKKLVVIVYSLYGCIILLLRPLCQGLILADSNINEKPLRPENVAFLEGWSLREG